HDGESLLRAQPTVRTVPPAVARLGVDLTFVQAATFDGAIKREGVVYEFVNDRRGMPVPVAAGFRLHRVPRRVIARVQSLAPDVVHLHGILLPLATHALVKALCGIPVVAHDHASMVPHSWRRRVWRWGFR